MKLRIACDARTNRVEYKRGALTEWYINGPPGLEQGFTLAKPPGKANGHRGVSFWDSSRCEAGVSVALSSAGTTALVGAFR
jgi:hypothetical protein